MRCLERQGRLGLPAIVHDDGDRPPAGRAGKAQLGRAVGSAFDPRPVRTADREEFRVAGVGALLLPGASRASVHVPVTFVNLW